ncbi:MAG: Fur family transcriptional regulator [Syntrophomonadaceae bacterium]|nr:Fur family transcriptional regulator [Syntrophomonadaceae bacterium]
MDLSSLKQQLAAKGYKMTRPRRVILEALAQKPGWVTAKDLHEEVCNHSGHIDFSTVCRNLDTLTGMEILCRVDRDNNGIFVYCLREMEEHHHHLICRCCGKTSPMDFCPLSQLSLVQTEGYSELECRFEVYGICHDCQAKQGN